MFLSIVIPAHNEEKRIAGTLIQYLEFFNSNKVEFIIVLNGCQDNTWRVVEDFRKKEPERISIINIKEAVGKGGAVQAGFKKAAGELISFVDADGATEPPEFDKIVKAIGTKDGAIASRWKTGSEVINRKFFRNVVSSVFRLLVKLLFGMPFIDTQCGAKVFKKELIATLLPDLKVKNMAFDVELLYLSYKRGFEIIEVPSRWIHKSSSATLGSPLKVLVSSIKIFFTLLKIRLRK